MAPVTRSSFSPLTRRNTSSQSRKPKFNLTGNRKIKSSIFGSGRGKRRKRSARGGGNNDSLPKPVTIEQTVVVPLIPTKTFAEKLQENKQFQKQSAVQQRKIKNRLERSKPYATQNTVFIRDNGEIKAIPIKNNQSLSTTLKENKVKVSPNDLRQVQIQRGDAILEEKRTVLANRSTTNSPVETFKSKENGISSNDSNTSGGNLRQSIFSSDLDNNNLPNSEVDGIIPVQEERPVLSERKEEIDTFLGRGASKLQTLADTEEIKSFKDNNKISSAKAFVSQVGARVLENFEFAEKGVRSGIDILDEGSRRGQSQFIFNPAKAFFETSKVADTKVKEFIPKVIETGKSTFTTLNTQPIQINPNTPTGAGKIVGTVASLAIPIPFVKGSKVLPKGTGVIDDLKVSGRGINLIDSSQPLNADIPVTLPKQTVKIEFQEQAGGVVNRIKGNKIDTTIREFPSGTIVRSQKTNKQEFVTVQKPEELFATVTKFDKDKKVSTTKIDPISEISSNKIIKEAESFSVQTPVKVEKTSSGSIVQSLESQKGKFIEVGLPKNQRVFGEVLQKQRVTSETISTPEITQDITTSFEKFGKKTKSKVSVDETTFKPAVLEAGTGKSVSKNDIILTSNKDPQLDILKQQFTTKQKSVVKPKTLTKTIVETELTSDLTVIRPPKFGKKGTASLKIPEPTLNVNKLEFPKSNLDIDLKPVLKSPKIKTKVKVIPKPLFDTKQSNAFVSKTNLLPATESVIKQNQAITQQSFISSNLVVAPPTPVSPIGSGSAFSPVGSGFPISQLNSGFRNFALIPNLPSFPKSKGPNDLTGFDVIVKTKEGNKKQNTQPLSPAGAFNRGASIVDNTKATKFQIVKSAQRRKPELLAHFFNPLLANKFKRSESNPNKYIEKKEFRLDALGEQKNKPIKLGNIQENTVLFKL